MKNIRRQVILLLITLAFAIILSGSASANDLNLTKGSWDTIGLDHNNVNEGSNEYNIQVRVTNNGSSAATNVNSTFNWNTVNPNINLAPGETTTKQLGNINPRETVDVFYLVRVNRTSTAYLTSRNYTISIFGDNTPVRNMTGSLYVEKLVSQNRNDVVSITTSNPTPSIGENFAVTVVSSTASATYDIVDLQLAYNPLLVKPISYNVTYGNNTSRNIRLDNPGVTNFVSVWIFQALAAGSNTFLGIITDQSGSSFHYNKDYGQSNIIQVIPKADLAITKTVNNTTPIQGNNVVFTLIVTNNGPNNATNVLVNDLLPAGLTYVSYTGGNYNSSNGIWNIGNLAVNQTATLNITALVNTNNTLINIANVTGNETDPNLTNNQAIVALNPVTLLADLGILKTVNNMHPHLEDIFTFTVTVFNSGPNTANNVTVTDSWPAGLKLLSATPSQVHLIQVLLYGMLELYYPVLQQY